MRRKERLTTNLHSLWLKTDIVIGFGLFFTSIRHSIMKYGALITKKDLRLDKAISEASISSSTTPNFFNLKVKTRHAII